jgi:hypothetical protein
VWRWSFVALGCRSEWSGSLWEWFLYSSIRLLILSLQYIVRRCMGVAHGIKLRWPWDMVGFVASVAVAFLGAVSVGSRRPPSYRNLTFYNHNSMSMYNAMVIM